MFSKAVRQGSKAWFWATTASDPGPAVIGLGKLHSVGRLIEPHYHVEQPLTYHNRVTNDADKLTLRNRQVNAF